MFVSVNDNDGNFLSFLVSSLIRRNDFFILCIFAVRRRFARRVRHIVHTSRPNENDLRDAFADLRDRKFAVRRKIANKFFW